MYDEIVRLHREGKTLCGFLREPMYQDSSNKIRGYCYMKKENSSSSTCKDRLPMMSCTDCKHYIKWKSNLQQ